jgi:hypothetical protein
MAVPRNASGCLVLVTCSYPRTLDQNPVTRECFVRKVLEWGFDWAEIVGFLHKDCQKDCNDQRRVRSIVGPDERENSKQALQIALLQQNLQPRALSHDGWCQAVRLCHRIAVRSDWTGKDEWAHGRQQDKSSLARLSSPSGRGQCREGTRVYKAEGDQTSLLSPRRTIVISVGLVNSAQSEPERQPAQ